MSSGESRQVKNPAKLIEMENWTRCLYIDSHTGGEPTRVIFEGGPHLGAGSALERAKSLAQHRAPFLNGSIGEPRGNDAVVGAILYPIQPESSSPSAANAGVIYYNPAGPLGMCGHGTIGVVETIRQSPKLKDFAPQWMKDLAQLDEFTLETPAGQVVARVQSDGSVEIENVASYLYRTGVTMTTDHYGPFTGDVAYGGNWFFLSSTCPVPIEFKNRAKLLEVTTEIKLALAKAGITGENDSEIDHVELFGPPSHPDAKSKNFVLCPGGAYDRSPCGTGTSAKLACLFASGKLKAGETWVQESITGSLFYGRCVLADDGQSVIPTIRGKAYICGFGSLVFDSADPLQGGIIEVSYA